MLSYIFGKREKYHLQRTQQLDNNYNTTDCFLHRKNNNKINNNAHSLPAKQNLRILEVVPNKENSISSITNINNDNKQIVSSNLNGVNSSPLATSNNTSETNGINNNNNNNNNKTSTASSDANSSISLATFSGSTLSTIDNNNGHNTTMSSSSGYCESQLLLVRRRSGIVPLSTNVDESECEVSIVKYPKTPDENAQIKSALKNNEFLHKILPYDDILQEIIDAMYKRSVAANELIICEGEKGAHLYVSSGCGRLQTTVRREGVVAEFDDVRVFGELAILYSAKRRATVRALTAATIWALDGTVFQRLLIRSRVRDADETVKFLQNVPVLNTVGGEVLQTVANLLESEFHPTGTEIVRQGAVGDKFYIVRAGQVTIRTNQDGVVGQLKRGQYFGELALLVDRSKQHMTVVADAPGVECLTLTRQHFIDHFGNIEGLLHSTELPNNTNGMLVNATARSGEFDEIQLHNLNVVATLGVGGFGRVELVVHKTVKEDQVFALKCVKKVDMLEQHQKEHVFNEKRIQMGCRCDFIVCLYRTYKDTKYLYFLMEPCLGGDVWTLLQKQPHRRFDEKCARFLAACVLEAFAYLHGNHIVYRDLKPENLLLDGDGYVKLTDFGFAKRLGVRGRTFTFAGTPEYIAPEIVLNRGHDKAVDYWAFGVLVFELLTGRTPFRTADSNHMRTYKRILAGIDAVDFPAMLSMKSRHLVQRLCRPLGADRLGCQRSGTQDVRSHKWFVTFQWEALRTRKLPSPFRPRLRHATDTAHFEQFEKEAIVPPDELSGWDKDF